MQIIVITIERGQASFITSDGIVAAEAIGALRGIADRLLEQSKRAEWEAEKIKQSNQDESNAD